jgi:hypothetical protein
MLLRHLSGPTPVTKHVADMSLPRIFTTLFPHHRSEFQNRLQGLAERFVGITAKFAQGIQLKIFNVIRYV